MATKAVKQQKTHALSSLISYYETCNRSEGKSPSTTEWYTANLRRFQQYLKSRRLPDSTKVIDTRLLREYVLYLMQAKKHDTHRIVPDKAELLSTATVHGHVRTLRAFFSWMLREDFVGTNLASALKPPKIERKVVTTLSDEEILTILRTFDYSNPTDARNQTIFMLLIDSGLRIGELVSLKSEDLHLDEGYIKVMGKGRKERVVPVGNNAQRAVQKYLFRYRPTPARSCVDTFFLSVHGDSMTENSMKQLFKSLARRSGIQRLHAHLCRHTFATRFLVNGGDVFTLQQILGHSTLEMVRRYVNLASSHIAVQHQRFSPLDRLKLPKN